MNVKLRVRGKGLIKLISEDKIHHTQELIPLAENEVQVNLMVYNTPELETFILGYGEGIEVIEPIALREILILRLNKAIHKYTS